MKKFFILGLALVLFVFALTGCGGSEKQSEVQKIIEQAQNMSLEELARKAIEESNGKQFYGVGNSSRGKSALPLFIKYLQTLDPNYNMTFEWQQPKNNKIFDQLTVDYNKQRSEISMSLVQDGNQIENQIQDNAAPVRLDVSKDAGECLLLGHNRLVFVVGILVEEQLQFSEFVFKNGFVGQMQFVFSDKCWRHAST